MSILVAGGRNYGVEIGVALREFAALRAFKALINRSQILSLIMRQISVSGVAGAYHVSGWAI